ncbi:hypothetical protein [Streptomyces sp. NPDC019224]|uniref:hypothetical protein n=1 Tax=Streptomyces sp. NPDC019224 TaxID=3154484 RepID=UPI0033C9BDBB
MRRTVRATGSASVESVWLRYIRTEAWTTWAPQIRAVEAEAELRVGLRGRVVPVVGPSIAFVVEAVDQQARTWQWRVRRRARCGCVCGTPSDPAHRSGRKPSCASAAPLRS